MKLQGAQEFATCTGLDISQKGHKIAVSKLDDQVYVFERISGHNYGLAATFRPRREVHQASVQWTSSGDHLLVAQDRSSLTLWSLEAGFEKPVDSKQGRYLMLTAWDDNKQEFIVATEEGFEVYQLNLPMLSATVNRKRPEHLKRVDKYATSFTTEPESDPTILL